MAVFNLGSVFAEKEWGTPPDLEDARDVGPVEVPDFTHKATPQLAAALPDGTHTEWPTQVYVRAVYMAHRDAVKAGEAIVAHTGRGRILLGMDGWRVL